MAAEMNIAAGGFTGEQMLVDRAKSGDAEAQGALFDHYWPKIVRYAYAHCGNAQDAEDVAAEVFLRMVEAIERFQWRENVPFAAWLFRIARNQMATYFRRRPETISFPESDVHEPSGPQDPQQMVEDQFAMDEVYRAAQLLPELQQEVIRLRFAADLSLADTAKILDKKENNVKQLQHKAILKMKQILMRPE